MSLAVLRSLINCNTKSFFSLSIKAPFLAAIVIALAWNQAGFALQESVSLTDAGAVGDGETINTQTIQSTIDKVSASGGGMVVVPAGVFKTGALYLKPGVELRLEKDAVLLGSTDIADYPTCETRIEGKVQSWRPALINVKGGSKVRITGEGTLDGNGEPFWKAFWKRRSENPKCTNLEVERPRLMYLEGCDDVIISGIHLKNSGFWNLHLYRCRNALIDRISITAPDGDPPKIIGVQQPWDEISIDRAPSSDGIDIDSCQNVTIRNTTISVGDDCIALKGTKGPTAMEDESSPPVENILIENCNLASGHGMVTCGSEATIIRNVSVRNCRVGPGVPIVRFKLRPDTPQLYENFAFDGIEAQDAQAIFDVKPWTQFFDLQGHEPPQSVVRNVTVRNLKGSLRSLGELRGNPGDLLANILLENLQLTCERDQLRIGKVEGLRAVSTSVNGQDLQTKSD